MTEDPFKAARRASLVRFAWIAGIASVVTVGGYGLYKALHEPTYSEQLDADREEFGAIASALREVPTNKGDPKNVAARKVLILHYGSPNQQAHGAPKEVLAKKAGEVGLVVTIDTEQDARHVLTYDDGSHGYGGVTTFRAIAWPEKTLVGELQIDCYASPVTYRFGNDKSDTQCTYDDKDLAAFLRDVRTGKVPREHSDDALADRAFERNAGLAALAKEMDAIDPTKLPRGDASKAARFLVLDKGAARQEWLDESLRAEAPEDVSVVIATRVASDVTTLYAFTRAEPRLLVGRKELHCKLEGYRCSPTPEQLGFFALAVQAKTAWPAPTKDAGAD